MNSSLFFILIFLANKVNGFSYSMSIPHARFKHNFSSYILNFFRGQFFMNVKLWEILC